MKIENYFWAFDNTLEPFPDFSGGSDGKESACNARDRGFDLWVGKIPWRRKWQPTSVFLPGKSHGQRSLAGYTPWGCKELDTTGATNTFTALWNHLHSTKMSHFYVCSQETPNFEAFFGTRKVIKKNYICLHVTISLSYGKGQGRLQ